MNTTYKKHNSFPKCEYCNEEFHSQKSLEAHKLRQHDVAYFKKSIENLMDELSKSAVVHVEKQIISNTTINNIDTVPITIEPKSMITSLNPEPAPRTNNTYYCCFLPNLNISLQKTSYSCCNGDNDTETMENQNIGQAFENDFNNMEDLYNGGGDDTQNFCDKFRILKNLKCVVM